MIIEKEGRVKNLPLYLLTFCVLFGGLIMIPNGIELRVQRVFNFAYAVFVAMALYTTIKIDLFLGLLILLAAFQMFFSLYSGIETNLFLTCLVFLFIAIHLTYPSWRSKVHVLYNVLCFIVLLNVLWQLLQLSSIYLITAPLPGTEDMKPGLMSNINETAALYAICLPAFFRTKWNWCIPVVFVGLIIARTTVGMTAAIVVLGIHAFRSLPINKYLVVAGMGLCFLLFVTQIDGFDFRSHKSNRISIWNSSIKAAVVKPFGWGFGQYKYVIPLMTSYKSIKDTDRKIIYQSVIDKPAFEKALNMVSSGNLAYFTSDKQVGSMHVEAHNEWIEWLFISGIGGLLLALYCAANIIFMGINAGKIIPVYGFLASCITAMGFFTWHIAPMAIITVVYMGLIMSKEA